MKNYHISQTLTSGLLTFIIAFFVFGITASRADIYEESYSVNGGSGELVPLGGQKMYYVDITEVQSNAIITKVEARFTYTAYNGVEQHLSCRFNRGSDPYSSGGVALVGFDQPYPPDSNGGPATLSYKSFNTWNGSSVNSTYYFRFFRDSVDPPSYEPTIFNVEVRITYVLPSPAPPTLSSPADGSILPLGSNITFSWVNSSSSVSNSSIKVCTDASMTTGCQFFETGLTQTIVSDSMFTPGVNYYWQARSKTSTSSWGIYGPTPAWSFTVDLPASPTLNLTAETWTGSRSGVSEPTFPYDGDVALWLYVQKPGRTVWTYLTLIDPMHGTRYCYYPDDNLPTGSESPPKPFSFSDSKHAMFTNTWTVEEGIFLLNRYIYSASNVSGQRTFTFWYEDSTTDERISEAEVSFSIQPLIDPQVSVTPSFGPQGTTFQQPGTGFTPNSTATLHFIRPELGETTESVDTDGNGAYSNPWLCDACPIGTYQYWAVDNTTGKVSNTVSFTVTQPQVSVSPSSGPQGTTFQQSGDGFTPNSTATLHFTGPDGSSTDYENTDGNGHYEHEWLCDQCPVGNYSYYAVDDTTETASNTVNFTITPPTADNPFLVPLFRDYSSNDTDHIYTTNPDERDSLVSLGYNYEKIEAYISNQPFQDGVPLFRLYHPTGKRHYYTTSPAERDNAISQGFNNEGIAGYVYPNPTENMVPMYHLYSSTNNDHFYTISQFERDNAVTNYGYTDMDIAMYVALNSSASPLAGMPVAQQSGVDLSSGNFKPYNNHVDFANPPGVGMPFVFARTYNAMDLAYSGPLGSGWNHSYNIKLFDNGVLAIVKWGNGRYDYYDVDGADYDPKPGIYNKVEKTGNTYALITKNGTTYIFEVYASLDTTFWARLKTIEDRNGNTMTLAYDDIEAGGNLSMVKDSSNRYYQFHYAIRDAGITAGSRYRLGAIVEQNVPLNRSIRFGYDAKGNLTSYWDAENNETKYIYDSDNRLCSIILANGNELTAKYDEMGRLENYTIGGMKTLLEYDDPVDGTTLSILDVGGNEIQRVSATHDESQLNTWKDGLGNTAKVLNYDENHNPTRIEDKNAKIWTFTYHPTTGNPLTETNPINQTTTYEYDPTDSNNLTKITDPEANITRYEYDTKGNLIKVIKVVDGVDRATSITKYLNGLTHTITDPRQHTTAYEYDAYGYLDKIIDPLTNETYFAFDLGGRLLAKTDADRISTHYTYDNLNKVKTARDHEGKITEYSYGGNGNLLSVKDPRQIVTRYSYNDRDLLASITDANIRVAKYNYDAVGRLTDITNAKDRTWKMSYDNANNLTSKTTPLAYSDTFPEYDGNGNLKRHVDRTGREMSYTYDDANRLEYLTVPGAQYHYTYYGNGLLERIYLAQTQIGDFIYNSLGKLKTYTDPNNKQVAYTYDAAGNPRTITYPDGKVVTYGYDEKNILSSVTDWFGNVTQYEYSPAGRLKKILYPSGAYIEYIYDSYGRLQTVNNKKSDGTIIAGYAVDTFDQLDAPIQITTTGGIEPVSQSMDVASTYDENNRLAIAGTATFTHNKLGEVLTRTKGGSTTSFEWAAGDVPGRLKKIISDTHTIEYAYDGLGNRISDTVDGITTRYVLDISGRMSNVLAETDANGSITAYYVHGLGLVSKILPDGTARYYHYDRTGNTVALTDASGEVTDQYAYDNDPYGFSVTAQGTTHNPFKFVGRYGVMDEGDNIYFMRARFYDAEVGRFLNEDPIGFEGGDMNLYVYVGGNPNMRIDPAGLSDVNLEEVIEDIVKDIGKELTNAGNWKVVHVSGYFSKNGKWVSEYWRRAPNTVKHGAGSITYLLDPALTFVEVLNDTNLTEAQKIGRMSISIIPFANTAGEIIDVILDVPEDEDAYDYIFTPENPVVDKSSDAFLWAIDKVGLSDEFTDWSCKSSWLDYFH